MPKENVKATRNSSGEIKPGGKSRDVAVRMPRNVSGQSRKGHGNPHNRGK